MRQQGTHRARLFPLPFLPPAYRPPCSSARNRKRFKIARTVINITNRAIEALNRTYAAPSYTNAAAFALRCHLTSPSLTRASCVPPPPPHMSQPDIPPFCFCCHSWSSRVAPPTPSPSFDPTSPSSAQLRVQQYLLDCCATFVRKVRAWCYLRPECDIRPEVLDALSSCPFKDYCNISSHTPVNMNSPHTAFARLAHTMPLDEWSEVQLPMTPSFSSQSTQVVPLQAHRVSLPDSLHIVPLARVLPPDLSALYSTPHSPALLRTPLQVQCLNTAAPLRAPRIAGARSEYVHLVGRLVQQGMVQFTSHPKAINGVFTVGKDADSDRLIIDAQPANRLFVDSPHVALPNPSHLVQLQVPAGREMFVGKTDLSNFYHHLGLPHWMQPYFALPPLTKEELQQHGLPTHAAYPMCVTLPMGFSHAVYLAQSVHLHTLYSSRALDPSHSLLSLVDPSVTADRVVHGVVIDDFFLFSLSRSLAQRVFDAVLHAYRAAGFVVKQSKVVEPTSDTVKVIGFDIGGRTASIALPTESMHSLARATITVLRQGAVTGTLLSHLMGRWTWVMLLRRCSLAVFQHAYRFVAVSKGRRFSLWPSVRAELVQLLGLLPLMTAALASPYFHRAIASDASEYGGGVVTTPLTQEVTRRLWPVCSTRHHAVLQTILNKEQVRAALHSPAAWGDPRLDIAHAATRSFDAFYRHVRSAPWTTIVSTAWRGVEHINALELRAALLAVHWALSFPSSLGRRVFLLVDSTVSFFALWKGRSSSPKLLLVLRKISALLLAGGLSLLPGWVPSAVNPADGPSRVIESECPTGRAAA